MKKIIVSSPSWFPSSGGITILHKFVHTLNDIGYDAYLAPSNASGLGWCDSNLEFYSPTRYNKVKFITDDIYNNLKECIVVYPESWYGNYLNAPNVVRWIMGLANPKFMSAGNYGNFKYDAWNENELWFWYADLYKTQSDKKIIKNLDNNLTLIEFYTDIFFNRNEERILNCWTLRKGAFDTEPSDYIHDPSDLFFGDIATQIKDFDFHFPGNHRLLADLFNKTNVFYSYDRSTFISTQAVMCGADSVVVPNKKMSKKEYYDGFELHKYIAYGLDELDRAKSIRNELDDHIKEIENKCINDVHLFVEKCNKYFK